MRINNNVMAANAQRNLNTSAAGLGKSLEKLSSGFRINRAADDAAGLVISQGLRSQVSGLKQATRNAQDGISVVQTAEGALTEVHNMLNRMRDLAVQAANTGSQDGSARAAAQTEIGQLREEIDRIAGTTAFGGQKLLNGDFGKTPARTTGFVANSTNVGLGANTTLDFDFSLAGGADISALTLTGVSGSASNLANEIQSGVRSALIATGTAANLKLANDFTVKAEAQGAGAVIKIELAGINATQSFAVSGNAATALNLSGVTAAAGTGGVFQVGSNVTSSEQVNISIGDIRITGGNVAAFSNLSTIDVATDATTAQTRIDAAITKVSDLRADLGAKQNRFESTISNLQVTTENLSASESRIRDTDMASEMVNFTKNNILQQAGTAMLAQANQLPQGILRLLG